MNKVIDHDLYQFQLLSNVVFAPDGAHAVFTKSNAPEKCHTPR